VGIVASRGEMEMSADAGGAACLDVPYTDSSKYSPDILSNARRDERRSAVLPPPHTSVNEKQSDFRYRTLQNLTC